MYECIKILKNQKHLLQKVLNIKETSVLRTPIFSVLLKLSMCNDVIIFLCIFLKRKNAIQLCISFLYVITNLKDIHSNQ